MRSASSGLEMGLPAPAALHHASSSRATALHSAGRHMDSAICRRPCAADAQLAVHSSPQAPPRPSAKALPLWLCSPSTPAPAHEHARASSTKDNSSRLISARRHAWRCTMDSSGASLRMPVASADEKWLRTAVAARSARSTAPPSAPVRRCGSPPPPPWCSPRHHIAVLSSSTVFTTSSSSPPLSASSRSIAPVQLKKRLSSAVKTMNSSTKP
mmetsp:Transcript_30696/g.76370  ORF Transcript_30696/g.76370 Transcript_30696/m.76370 type:complete len:213 (-) Transcript_30696:1257-1895(-)